MGCRLFRRPLICDFIFMGMVVLYRWGKVSAMVVSCGLTSALWLCYLFVVLVLLLYCVFRVLFLLLFVYCGFSFCMCVCVRLAVSASCVPKRPHKWTKCYKHTYTHTYIYIYVYMYICIYILYNILRRGLTSASGFAGGVSLLFPTQTNLQVIKNPHMPRSKV